MTIDRTTLEKIEGSEEEFAEFFADYTEQTFAKAGLAPRLSLQRLIEAHGAWKHDLGRVGTHEPRIEDGLDHFKRSGHLAFWIRRFCPIVEATSTLAPGEEPTVGQEIWRALLHSYSNEFVAFMLGYNFCLFYEKATSSLFDRPRAHRIVLTNDYIETVCHFLKYKTASPHSITLIYKSLFLGN